MPTPSAIWTLDKNSNGIVSVNFGEYGQDPACDPVAENFSDKVYGHFNYSFCTNFSEEIIAYCKTNFAVIVNVKTNEAFHAKCDLSLNDRLTGISFLDPQSNTFVIVKSNFDGKCKWKNYLHIAKLDDENLVDTNWSMQLGESRSISPDFPTSRLTANGTFTTTSCLCMKKNVTT